MKKYTINDFLNDFPDDRTCLEWLKSYLYPKGIYCKKCKKITKHHRIKSRPSYSCDYCGHHVHPTAGTIFEKSTTSLKLWFYAVYLMSSTRCGISAKQLQRELGVTYKTAWRIFNRIRNMLYDKLKPKTGIFEADETYISGKKRGKRGRDSENKTIIFGIAQRKGRLYTTKIESVSSSALIPVIKDNVIPIPLYTLMNSPAIKS